jgi:hypothetical protein
LNPSKDAGKQPSADNYVSDIRGTLHGNVLKSDSNGTQVAFVFDDLDASVSVSSAVLADDLANLRSHPLVATYNGDGEIVGLEVNKANVASKLAANVVYRLQVPLFKLNPNTPATAKEVDENGRSEVRVIFNSLENLLEKSNQRYVPVSDSPFFIDADTKVVVEMAKSGFTKMSGAQTLQFTTNQTVFSKVSNSWSFHSLSESTIGQDEIARLRKLGGNIQVVLNADQISEEQRLRRLTSESDLEGLLNVIHEPSFGTASNKVGKTIAQLVAFLKTDLKAVLRVREIIETADLDSPAFVYGLGALVQAGTPEIQTHFVHILRDRAGGDSKRLFRFVSHLHDLKSPTPELADSLMELSTEKDDFIRRAALLAVGTAAGRLIADKPKEEIIKNLVELWGEAKSIDEKVLVLRSLGNSGAKETLAVASMGLAPNESYIIRKAAAEALRWNTEPERHDLLIESYFNDSNIDVKRSVLQSLQFQALPENILLRLVQDLIRQEGNDSLTILLMNTVWRYRDKEPLISQAVAQLANRQSDLGREAKRLLNQI